MRRSKALSLRRHTVVSLAFSVFAACSDGNGPPGDLDPTEAAAALDNIVAQYFDQNDALNSLGFFGAFLGIPLSPAVAPVQAISALDVGTTEAVRLGALASVNEWQSWRASGSSTPERIPVGALGKTFRWNELANPPGYEIDPDATGAPANGVRFILYGVDPIFEQPISPLTEIGYLDIIDTSSFPTINISMTAHVNGRGDLLGVDVSGSSGQTSFTLATDGFVSNGQQQLTFGIDVSGTSQSVDFSFDFSFATFSARLVFEGEIVNDELGSGSLVVTLTDTSNNGTAVFSLSVDSQGLIGENSGVTLNGDLVAIITGNMNDPLITNAQGDPLTPAELQALGQLFEGIGDVFEIFMEIFTLSLFLILLGAT